jgi:hypothetical protein
MRRSGLALTDTRLNAVADASAFVAPAGAIGVADGMKEAGSGGGFYKHFESRDEPVICLSDHYLWSCEDFQRHVTADSYVTDPQG